MSDTEQSRRCDTFSLARASSIARSESTEDKWLSLVSLSFLLLSKRLCSVGGSRAGSRYGSRFVFVKTDERSGKVVAF